MLKVTDHSHSHVAAWAVANEFESNQYEASFHRARAEHGQLDRRAGAQGLAFSVTARSMAGWLSLVWCVVLVASRALALRRS